MMQRGGSNSVQRRARNGDVAAKKRPWYKRALGGLTFVAPPAGRAAAPAQGRTAERRPGWWASLKAASAALAREACVCAPLCPYDGVVGVHVDAVAPTRRRRSASSAGGGGLSPVPARRAAPSPRRAPPAVEAARRRRSAASSGAAGGVRLSPVSARRAVTPAPRRAPTAVAPAVEGPRRRVSSRDSLLWDDELMRRLMLSEEGARRRGEMEMAKQSARRKWRAPGQSRLRRMSLAHVADAEHEAGGTNGLS